jgi:hypothetical protein
MNKTTGGGINSVAPHSGAAAEPTRHGQVPSDSLATKKDDAQERELKILFPWTLHSLLEDAEKEGFNSTVSWRPSGLAFKVHHRDEFMDKVLPRYFRQTKFKSFVRQLNLWGFSCIDQGPDKGSCMYTIVDTMKETYAFAHLFISADFQIATRLLFGAMLIYAKKCAVQKLKMQILVPQSH